MNEKQIAMHPIFKGLKAFEIYDIVSKGEMAFIEEETPIYRVAEKQYRIGIILEGDIHIYKMNYWGERTLLQKHASLGMFSHDYIFRKAKELPVEIYAKTKCEILFITHQDMLLLVTKHPQFMINLFAFLSNTLYEKECRLQVMQQATIRQKVSMYLSDEAQRQRNFTIKISMNRNELAKYLNVDRSALSNELSKMQKEGIIRYQKNTFILL